MANKKKDELVDALDRGFKKLEGRLDQQFEDKFIKLFNQGFEEVVRPEIEDLREGMNQKFDKVDSRFDSLERKMDGIYAKDVEQDNKLKEHGERLHTLEQPQTSS